MAFFFVLGRIFLNHEFKYINSKGENTVLKNKLLISVAVSALMFSVGLKAEEKAAEKAAEKPTFMDLKKKDKKKEEPAKEEA